MEGRDDAHGAGGHTGKDVGKMGGEKDYISSFDEYLRQGEPSKMESAANWQAAIGLQAVDGLRPSAYLLEVAGRNIEGEITLEESRRLIDSYYKSKNRTHAEGRRGRRGRQGGCKHCAHLEIAHLRIQY